jgi:pimeloyl-ACP methyl ester carboxylesterase
VLEFFVRPFLPLGFRPLRKADFSSPQLREGIGKFMPNLNLDDSATQQAMRDFRVPLSLIDQIRGLSRLAYAHAAKCAAPTLVIQGSRDDVVRVPRTRKLIARFRQPPRYVEVDSAHDLTIAQNPAYPQVEAAVVEFARSISRHSAA